MSERIVIQLDMDDKGLVRTSKRVGKSLKPISTNADAVKRSLDRTEGSMKQFGKRVRDVTVSLASLSYILPNLTQVMFFWQTSMIDANAELEKSIAIMKNFSKETNTIARDIEARNFVDIITNKAKNAPFSVKAMTDSFVKMKSGGIDPLNGSMDALANAVANFGGNDNSLKRASVAIQQMGGKGVISMEELRQQLGEAVPSAANVMALSLGTTYAQLVKQISMGNIAAIPALKAMSEEMQRQFGGAAAAMMETWSGVVARFQTEMDVSLRAMGGNNGYFEGLKDTIKEMTVIISSNKFKKFLKNFSESMARGLETVKAVVLGLYDFRQVITTIIGLFFGLKIFFALAGAVTAITKNMKGLIGASRLYNAEKKRSNILMTKESFLNARAAKFHKQSIKDIKKQRVSNGQLKNMKSELSKTDQIHARSMANYRAKQYADTQKQIVASRKLGRTAAFVKTGLGGIVGILGTVAIGFFISMIADAINAKNKTKEAADEIIRLKGLYAELGDVLKLEDSLKLTTKELAVQEDKLKNINKLAQEKAIREDAKNKGRPGFGNADGIIRNTAKIAKQMRIEFTEEINKLEKKVLQTTEAIKQSAISIAKDVSESSVQIFGNNLIEGMKQVRSGYKAAQEQLAEDKKTSDKEDEKVQALLEKRRLANIAMFNEEQIKLSKKLRANQVALISKGGTDAEVAGLKDALAEIDEIITKQKEYIASDKLILTDALLEGSDLIGTGNDQEKHGEKIQKKIQQIKLNIQELNLEAKDGSIAFQKFINTLGKTFDSVRYADATAELKRQFMAYQKLQTIKKEEAALETKKLSLLDKIQKKTDSLIASQIKQNGIIQKSSTQLFSAGKEMAKYTADITGLTLEMKELGASRKDARFELAFMALEEERSAAVNKDNIHLMSQINGLLDSTTAKLSTKTKTQKEYYLGLADITQQSYNALLKNNTLTEEQASKILLIKQNYIALAKEAQKSGYIQGQAIRDLVKDWGEYGMQMEDVTVNALGGFVDAFSSFLETGKFDFKSFADSIISDIVRMITKMMVFKAIESTGFGSLFGGSGGGGESGGGITDMSQGSTIGSATGNVVGSFGARNLNMKEFAAGGVANSPQLSIFGEGSTPEAYVPLPDGRSIPVSMKGGGSSETQVNIINQSGSNVDGESSTRFDGEKMVVDIVLKNLTKPSPIREAVKGVRS